MTWFFAVLVVLALGGIAVLAAGRGAPLVEEYDDRPDVDAPATGPLTPADLRRVRFPLAFRGYRMAEVDALLDRLATQLDDPAGAPDDPAGPSDDPAGPSDDPRDLRSRGEGHTG